MSVRRLGSHAQQYKPQKTTQGHGRNKYPVVELIGDTEMFGIAAQPTCYDQDYRLGAIQVWGVLNRTYGYDPANNILAITNALSSANNQTYSYDAVGNRLSETRNGVAGNYIYENNNNRLQQITRSSGNRGFTYDAAGNPFSVQRTITLPKTLRSIRLIDWRVSMSMSMSMVLWLQRIYTTRWTSDP